MCLFLLNLNNFLYIENNIEYCFISGSLLYRIAIFSHNVGTKYLNQVTWYYSTTIVFPGNMIVYHDGTTIHCTSSIELVWITKS